jgi:DNA-directed RNA polymerase subunit RPC12/RpoP
VTSTTGLACTHCPHPVKRSDIEKDGFVRCPSCGKLTGPVGPTHIDFNCDECGHRLKFRG